MATGGFDTGEQTEALVDTGASSSFVTPSMVANLKLPTEEMCVGVRFQVASGSELVVRTVVKQARFRYLETWADLLVALLPYNMILGTDWLCRELVVWDFGRHRLIAQGDKGGLELPVVENVTVTDLRKTPACKNDFVEVVKQLADDARRLMVEDVETGERRCRSPGEARAETV